MATLALVVANLSVAFFAPFSSVLALFAFDPTAPSVTSALTSLFLHDPANILHLLGNMVFLAAVGPLVESAIGPLKFFATYIVSGVIGVAVHWAFAKATGVSSPLIGASASVAGCVGYCSLRYRKKSVMLAPNRAVPVVAVIVFWLFLQGLGVFVSFEGAGGAAFHAHVGGFLAGFVLAFLFKAQTHASVEYGHARLEEMDSRSPAAALIAAIEHLVLHPHDVKALWVCYEAHTTMGETKKAVGVLLRLKDLGEDPHRIVAQLVQLNKLGVLSPTERMRLADKAANDLSIHLLESVVAEPDSEHERPNALLALAEVSNGEARQALLAELNKKYALHSATQAARAKGLM